ncbi:MAG: CorA family divalent cation transporter, partial [Dehalococcoidales bacterium]
MNDILMTPDAGDNKPEEKELFHLCPDTTSFKEAIEVATGDTFDLQSVLELTTDFAQVTSQYLLLNIKGYNAENPDNLLFLTEDKIFVCSRNAPTQVMVNSFEEVLEQPYGKSTVIAFLVINKIHDSHALQLEAISKRVRPLDEEFDHDEYRALSLEFERFSDRLEDFYNFLIGLQERRYKQIQTQHISFDYRVLIAECQSLQTRCRRRLSYIKDLRQDHEMKSTEELNTKIVRMNDILKKLTSITVILMLPTLIASHFGMNFLNMPELKIAWVYPA